MRGRLARMPGRAGWRSRLPDQSLPVTYLSLVDIPASQMERAELVEHLCFAAMEAAHGRCEADGDLGPG